MIVNASPLIIFAKIDKLTILESIYRKIEIAQAVYDEVVIKGNERKDALMVKEYVDKKVIVVHTLSDAGKSMAEKLARLYGIDRGEAETIALALQRRQKSVVIDEIAARDAAKAAGITPIGSLGVLLLAHKQGLITRDEIESLLEKMLHSYYRFSPEVILRFWRMLER